MRATVFISSVQKELAEERRAVKDYLCGDPLVRRFFDLVGTRDYGPRPPVEYELPEQAVAEAIVNAVTHSSYTSDTSVQMMLFCDRLEVCNPGELPPPFIPVLLREPHPSTPRNPLIAERLFLAQYIEKAGTGTLDVISLCREAGFPEPGFGQQAGQFVQAIWRPQTAATAKLRSESRPE